MNHSIISNDVFSGGLTCVDEKLIRDSRMINVMNGSCKNGGQDLQICEDSLQKKKGGAFTPCLFSFNFIFILLVQARH